MMKRFELHRLLDQTIVAEGVHFSSGRCVVAWPGAHPPIVFYEKLDDLIAIHGHNGKIRIEWIDDPEALHVH